MFYKSTNNVFELQNVSFSYLDKYPALYDINLDINSGERICFIGANGCGKSTLLHILDGLIFPQKGSINAFGNDLNERAFSDETFSRDFRKRVGLVFQNPEVQLFCPTVKEDILFGPLHLGLDKKHFMARFDKLIKILNIKDLLERAPHQLSIGEKRKAAIASTLIIDPQVLILDEPTAGLDPFTTKQIINLLNEEHLLGKTIITSTHDLHIIEEIADMIYVFCQEKKIIKQAAPAEILIESEFLKENNLQY